NLNLIYYNDSDKHIEWQKYKYLSNSSLELNHAIFDESGENTAIIKGFFAEDCMNSKEDFLGSLVLVMSYKAGSMRPLFKYKTVEFTKDTLSFTLTLKPISTGFGQQIVSLYSKSCRARFRDSRCKVNKANYPGQECDKSLTMCIKTYKNAVNFRGEPFIPTYEYFNKLNE
ncbi:MAG: DUF2163 domain-containing protein, partial [Alphaproteobacteria bacterium]|nr:DUF2163 domain-containing protein [Alphaproteobacteria bacterium]